MKKKLLSLVLAVLMLAAALPTASLANAAEWDGTSAASFAGGDGTDENPYQISSEAEFSYFADCIKGDSFADYNDKSYVLTSDIDLSSVNWEPIGKDYDALDEEKIFIGKFDGKGHNVNYRILVNDKTSYTAFSLFGISIAKEIKNLNVSGSITANNFINCGYIGGIVGLLQGDIKNCTSSVDILLSSTANTNMGTIGGVVGDFWECVMENCLFDGTIVSEYSKRSGYTYVGGICGTNSCGTITACKNEGTVDVMDCSFAGGIVGQSHTSGEPVTTIVENCYNTGTVTSVTGNASGIVSSVSAVNHKNLETNSIVRNCYTTGTVNCAGTGIGANTAAVSYLHSEGGDNVKALVENCFYTDAVGIDDVNAQKKTNDEIYDLIIKNADSGVWVKDADGNARLAWEMADYTKVDNAIASVPADMSMYTDESVKVVTDAVSAVVRDKERDEQTAVDKYADDINAAVASLKYKPADYSKVDAAIAKANALNKAEYSNYSAVETAINAVVRDKNITQQADVDAMALAIENAISALVKPPVTTTQPTTTQPAATQLPVSTTQAAAEEEEKDAVEEDSEDEEAEKSTKESSSKKSPMTGSSDIAMLVFAALISFGAVLSVMFVYNKKRKYNK